MGIFEVILGLSLLLLLPTLILQSIGLVAMFWEWLTRPFKTDTEVIKQKTKSSKIVRVVVKVIEYVIYAFIFALMYYAFLY